MGNEHVARRVSRIGVDVFVRMIFQKNFVHGDLHPGNILVCGLDPETGEHRLGNSHTANVLWLTCFALGLFL